MSVRLRRLAREDGPRVLEWRNRPEISAFMYGDHVIGEAEHARWLDLALTGTDRCYWVIELDGAPVGLANLASIDPAASRCDWAFYLADPAVRGRGIGAAVEWLVVGHVFDRLGLDTLWCQVLCDNTAVIRLHERFGFTRDALWTAHVIKAGRPRDVVSLRLGEREWANVKTAAEQRLALRFEVSDLQLDA